MMENFLDLGKETDVPAGNLKKVPNVNPNRPTARHVLVRITKLNLRGLILTSKWKTNRNKETSLYIKWVTTGL